MEQKTLSAILDVAVSLAESGAEISRIEESIIRMCSAYNFGRIDAYATTSHILVSAETKDGDVKMLQRRVFGNSINIEKMHRLNSLVRHISANAPSVNEIKQKTTEINATKKNSAYVLPLFYAIIAVAFAFFFGCRNLNEAVVAFIVGNVIGVLEVLFGKIQINKILMRFVCSLFASFLVRFFISVGFISSPDYVIIGNIMSLIPGIGITNALRDLLSGDIITGILRSIEALLLTVAIALGFALPSIILGGGF